MEELDVRYHPGEEYRELFNVMIDANKCTSSLVGIRNDGELLYVYEELMNNSSAYWMGSRFYRIDKEEYRELLKTARERGYIEKAIKQEKTTEEELEELGK